MNPTYSLLLTLFCVISFTACDKDSTTPDYEVPKSYSFVNVDYKGSTEHLEMLDEITAYMAESQSSGNVLAGSRLESMYANIFNQANWQGEIGPLFSLKFAIPGPERPKFGKLFMELAIASQSTVNGSPGQSGLISGQNGVRSYLIGDDGLDHAQIIEKGLMGACFYNNITKVFFSPANLDVDNEVVENGRGTRMEHNWDIAFGFLGVPKDFPSNTSELSFLGWHSNERNSLIGTNAKLMNDFLKGRAAISNNDLEERGRVIKTIRENLELVLASSIVHYLNESINSYYDVGVRANALSASIGLIYSLQFNPSANISLSEIDDLLETIAGSDDFDEMNIYNVTLNDINYVKEELVDYYSLDDIKDML